MDPSTSPSRSITIHGCLFSQSDESLPLTLSASMSFPSCRHSIQELPLPPTVTAWAARPVDDATGHLELTLNSPRIAEGRIGLVYSAHVEPSPVSSETSRSLPGFPTFPEELCLKFAKPSHCRSLAREAWFYEQLHEVQGVSTAKCVGFFTTPIPKDAVVKPWDEADDFPYFLDRSEVHDDMPSADWLPDDSSSDLFTDEHGFKRNSTWNRWEPSEREPLLAVLVLEKLGKHYFCEDEEPKIYQQGLRNALRNIVDDVSSLGVMHCNITAYNILFVAEPAQSLVCSRHNKTHGFRLIDFDRSLMIDPANCHSMDVKATEHIKDVVGDRDLGFWGTVR